jgi:hypothetical protein
VEASRHDVLGEADDVDDVHVESHRRRQRRDEHAVAESADAGERCLELDRQHVAERRQVGTLLEGVEAGQPGQGLLNGSGCGLLLEWQPGQLSLAVEQTMGEIQRPGAELGPGGQGVALLQGVA